LRLGISTSTQKLDLEITGLVFQEYLQATFNCTACCNLSVGLLEQAKVIGRCPNKHLQSILA